MRYYAKGQAENERTATQLRTISFASAIVAAIFGVAGSSFGWEWFAPCDWRDDDHNGCRHGI
jgi:hypothetical protein